MNAPKVLVFVLSIVAFSFPTLAEPKAYDLVKYRGKTADGMTIAFDFADGYPEASEVRITAAGKGKKSTTTTFVLDGSGKMRFVPKKDSSEVSEEVVLLKMSMDEVAPAKVEGLFHRAKGEEPISFSLTKQ